VPRAPQGGGQGEGAGLASGAPPAARAVAAGAVEECAWLWEAGTRPGRP